MIQLPPQPPVGSQPHPFAALMQRLGETFTVSDVMVPLAEIASVNPSDRHAADRIVREKKYSVVPASLDSLHFPYVFWTEHHANSDRAITDRRDTNLSDHIPDSTPLAEAFYLFDSREWYFAIRANRVSGLITYWAFNSREFRVQLYAGLSRVEELSRDLLAGDKCGVDSEHGLRLSPAVIQKARERFEFVRQEMGGNRFVDELQFHHVHEALRKHKPWFEFLQARLAPTISKAEYEREFNFTEFRDAVMHGRTLFPTYRAFKSGTGTVRRIGELIDHLHAYIAIRKAA